MEPNFEDFSCTMSFGVAPLPPADDPAFQQPCLKECPVTGSGGGRGGDGSSSGNSSGSISTGQVSPQPSLRSPCFQLGPKRENATGTD
eukprot:scaffold65_cov353-Prasinococcus_capsulatus_cf.AAC.4